MPLAPGQTLSHYQIRSLLGVGGMGEVYSARDTRLERDVAIKILPHEFVQDAERLARFEREARALAALNHACVAQVYGIDHVDGTVFIAMELVEGEDLATRLERGALPLEEALKLCARIADGLEAAHELGVVHRDLKPANVMLTLQEQPKVLDFGLAMRVERPGSGSPTPGAEEALTRTGVGMGSPGYMSPEQARGKPVDRRTDLFAFGCVLYECLSGARTFVGQTPVDSVAAMLGQEPDWARLPAHTPARVRDLLARCLAKDPERRQRDAGDVALELRAALEGSPWSDEARRARPSPLGLLAAALLAAIVIAAVLITTRTGPEPSAPGRTVRFDIELPAFSLATSDRLMNELALSPDGTTIIYVAEQGDRVAVHAHDLTSGTTRELQMGKSPRGAIFSRDGRSIAFIDEFQHLALTSLEGGTPRRVAKVLGGVGGSGVWLDDGLILLPAQGGEINAYPLDGSTPRTIVECVEPLLGFDNLSRVPGQSWFLASGWYGQTVDDYQIMAVDPETGEHERLLDRGSHPCAVGGRYLVFLRGASLMAMPFDFDERRSLGPAELLIESISTDDWGGSGQYALSAEGTLVYAPGRRRGEGRRLVWAAEDGSFEPILAGEDAYVGGAQLSFDQEQLAFCTLRHTRQVWTLDQARGLLSTVDCPGEAYSPIFARDGKSIYCYSVKGRQHGLYQAPVGGAPSRLLVEGPYAPTSVSPDGKRLLLDRAIQDQTAIGADILTLDLERPGATPEPLLDDIHDDSDGQISPDGQWLAYVSNRSGKHQVYVRAFASGDEWPASATGWCPRWAPDGRSLYYVNELALMNVMLDLDQDPPRVRLGQRREVLHSLTFAEQEEYSVARDGRVAIVELAEWERTAARLRVVVGWLCELDERFGPR